MWVYECLSKNTWFSGNTTMPIRGQLVYSLEGDGFPILLSYLSQRHVFSVGVVRETKGLPTYITCYSFTVGEKEGLLT